MKNKFFYLLFSLYLFKFPAVVGLPESLHSENLKISLHFIANFPATNNKPVN